MNNFQHLLIDLSKTVLDTLKQMDSSASKLLIITKNGKYQTIVSIGDLQRAILKDTNLLTPLSQIKIDNKVVCYESFPLKEIKEKMAEIRTEFMPVLNDKNELVTVYFWNDLFGTHKRIDKEALNLPVVIMAGGKGSRLKPISNIIPKPLIPIGDKTIVENIMDRFIEAGCTEFHLSVNYKKELIEHYFETNGNYNVDYFVEDKPLGTAGSLHLLDGKISTSFFVSNCDMLIEQDYHDLYEYHKKNKNEITLVVALKHYSIPYGTVLSGEDGLLEEMSEKPELTFKINAGLYLLEPELLNEIPKDAFFHITELITQVKERGGRVGVFPVSEKSWVDIGEWPEYIKTVRSISNDSDHFLGLL
jgi:dTDP-glucose pyrophosphorylase